MAMPLLTAVHAQFQQGMKYCEPPIRQLIRELRAAFVEQGVNVTSSRAALYFRIGERDVARLWINKNNVVLALRQVYSDLVNPDGLGRARVHDALAGWNAGYFDGQFTHPSQLAALLPLIRQTVDANRA